MVDFYERLGFGVRSFQAEGATYYSVHFGDCRINFHLPEVWESETLPPDYLRGDTAIPGCGDICFVWDGTLSELTKHLDGRGITIVKGPVEMSGGRAQGSAKGTSVYCRDPDTNLLEFIVY